MGTIERLLVLGATGDLAARFLFPALAELCNANRLPAGLEVIGAAQVEQDDESFRKAISRSLEEFASDIPASAREALLRRVFYRPIRLGAEQNGDGLRELLHDSGGGPGARPVATYLALPPRMFVPAITALGAAALPSGSRIVVEKPFGENLESAVSLNRLLADVTRSAGDQAVFRVDHVLGMATVHNLLGVRFANRVFEPLWNSTHIERIDVLWEETLALEGRAGYYDKAGALKDVMQNHMLQVLALVAMEPPASLERDLAQCKIAVLRGVRAPARENMQSRTRRARYTAGRLADTGGASGTAVPDYADEEGVDPARHTETFAEVVLEIDNERWAGTQFVLRTGKALAQRRKGVIVRFRPASPVTFGTQGDQLGRNQLLIGLDGPESFTLRLTGSRPGPPPEFVPLELKAQLPETEFRAYSQVLLQILSGSSMLSVHGDEAEESWRIMSPILRAWAQQDVPLDEYAAGSTGPPGLSSEPGR